MSIAPPVAPLFARLGGRPALLRLLTHFYADVRSHREIGPIFAAHVSDWPAHVARIADFWSGVTGGPAHYSGPMPFKHRALGLEERHFAAWLELWARHCRIWLPSPEAAELTAAAQAIGLRLRQFVGVDDPRPPAA